MAVTSTAVTGRLRFTYDGENPDMRLNGINPSTTAVQVLQLLNGVQRLQRPEIDGAFITVEHNLVEA